MDFVDLDTMPPGTNGLTLARELSPHAQVPIIMPRDIAERRHGSLRLRNAERGGLCWPLRCWRADRKKAPKGALRAEKSGSADQ
ncbi:MAG: hypothetical protein JSS01_19095 [Proteobacteria bacterium]|nr:hypothetical protein [Pseudomonadota bacterium]